MMASVSRTTRWHVVAWAAIVLSIGGCAKTPQQALGTLEYDRITVPAVRSERIVSVHVKQGQQVRKGQLLLQLDPSLVQADLAAAEAQMAQRRAILQEQVSGPRKETVARARADLRAAQARARVAREDYARVRTLDAPDVVSASAIDQARAAFAQAEAQVAAASAALDVLLHGSRPEDIDQARAALQAAEAQVSAQRILLRELRVTAPRSGRIDSLPYRRGDRPPRGAPLAVLLVGKAPYARIYVPEPMQVHLRPGQKMRVEVVGGKRYTGTLRWVRSDPVYTPYYALSGEDAARLSYLAEVVLGPDAAGLPAGLPVRVRLADTRP